MTGIMKLYIGSLVPALVLLGGGLWFLFNPVPVIDIPGGEPVIVDILEDGPIIVMDIGYTMRGEASKLSIFEDGAVIYHKEDDLRVSTPENPPTRTSKKGLRQEGELNGLIDFFESSRFDQLDEYYQYPGVGDEGGLTSDMDCAISIDYGGFTQSSQGIRLSYS